MTDLSHTHEDKFVDRMETYAELIVDGGSEAMN